MNKKFWPLIKEDNKQKISQVKLSNLTSKSITIRGGLSSSPVNRWYLAWMVAIIDLNNKRYIGSDRSKIIHLS